MDTKKNAHRRRLEKGINDIVRRLHQAVQREDFDAAQSEAFQLYQMVDDYTGLADGIVE